MADEIVVRGSELAAVTTFLDRGAGGLAALVVEGEAGIGKSTVWEAARRGRCDLAGGSSGRRGRRASEQGLTLGGLTDLFGDVGDETLARLPAPQRQALGVALLRIEARRRVAGPAHAVRRGRRPAAAPRRGTAGPDRDRRCPVARREHRRDPRLRAAAARATSRSACSRPCAPAPRRRHRTGSWPPLPADRLERVELGPMHLAALHQLFQVRLGRSFPRLVLVRIEEASGGNPLYALELGRALIRDGTRPTAAGRCPMPDSLGSLIAGRVSRLPEPTRHAMLLAAAAAEPTVDDAGAGESRDRGRPAAGGRGPPGRHRATASSGSPTHCSRRR